MAVVEVKNIQGETVSEIDLSEEIFNVGVKQSVLHQVVRMQLANRRRGTAKVKRRSEIRGSTQKLFRQKGTGRARRGDVKSPLLRGGGVIFGPEPRDYSYKVPKKVRRLALKMALSAKLKDNEIIVLDGFALDQVKTKAVASTLQRLELEKPLIVIDQKDATLELSSRNIPGVKVLRVEGLNVYDILNHKTLVLLAPSIKGIEGRLAA
ncbi:large subunit ribosomal protein L4 [Desulfosalsimonas propionicica]|uniref:Large ribosomal subunit protein uL4 n=1 Tax=Desulfosalsimonas propionicica TaxID=332175 RepID=A0A7W0CA32_9BACT|nr:50S ribosomal protein L4 [Desulfosalsimonas propionicica]MBA2881933.1 large subunit ribosomal protein L4 [Desulfosalsimonas propionicica]